MDELITYMGYEWVQIDGGILTIGLTEEGLEEFDSISHVDLPDEQSQLAPDEVCGELDTDQGPVNLYCPVDGRVIEINEAVIQRPTLIQGDCFGDGWLFKVEAENPDQIDGLTIAATDEGDPEPKEE